MQMFVLCECVGGGFCIHLVDLFVKILKRFQ